MTVSARAVRSRARTLTCYHIQNHTVRTATSLSGNTQAPARHTPGSPTTPQTWVLQNEHLFGDTASAYLFPQSGWALAPQVTQGEG